MIVDIRITLRTCRGESRRFLGTGRQQSRRRFGEPTGLHRGLRAGHVSPGVTRELGRATCLLAQLPERGTGRPKALACVGGFDPHTSPMGTPRTDGSTQGIGTRVTSEAARDGQGAVLVLRFTNSVLVLGCDLLLKWK